jgi:hypothetical protein
VDLIANRFAVSVHPGYSEFVPSPFFGNERLMREFRDTPRVSFERGLDIITA